MELASAGVLRSGIAETDETAVTNRGEASAAGTRKRPLDLCPPVPGGSAPSSGGEAGGDEVACPNDAIFNSTCSILKVSSVQE